MPEGRIERAPSGDIVRIWDNFTGVPVVTVTRTYTDASDAEALVWLNDAGEVRGHVSWALDGGTAEIVTIEALDQGVHIGGRLLDAAEAEIRARGARRIVVTTTNDNIRAQAFYMRRGFRLARIEKDGMRRVRALKPGVPETGYEGLPLLDMWEFEKRLD
jgi:ribosomal protein S18 acetylase RimI-like enzyme